MNPLPAIERQAFLGSLSRYINTEADRQGTLGLLLIDVMEFTQINHNHGFAYGDQVLQHCFSRLLAISRMPDTVFRVGDHRFAFLLPNLQTSAFIALAFDKVSTVLQEDLVIDNERVDLEFRIGIALNEAAEFSAEKTLQVAEDSLHQAKSKQKNPPSLTQADSGIRQSHQLKKSFAEKLKANDFQLYYQPKVNLLSGEIYSAEAMLHWQISDQKFISPQLAIEIAEEAGQSLEFTKWMIHAATRQIKDWENQGLLISVSVNVPDNLIQDPELYVLVEDSLAIWGVDGNRLTLGVTESAIIEDMKVGFETLLKLKLLGVGISIDEFGTGYSSLSYFKQFPADELKLDASFVSNVGDNSQDQEIVKIIIKIAKLFDLKLVAEGVEDQQTYDYLKKLGCDYGQGHFVSKALSAEDFGQLMQLEGEI